MSFLRSEMVLIPGWIAAMTLVSVMSCASSAQSPRASDASTKPIKELGSREISKYLITRDVRSGQPSNTEPPALTASAIVQKLMAANSRRSAELRGFQGKRTYQLQYHGLLGTRDATMQVLAAYNAPDQRTYSLISQAGSKLLLNRVLLKLLDSEKEAYRNQKQVELSPENYQFDLIGTERTPGGSPCYVLAVKPHKDNKFLYRGKIWVDASDFAVARMEGQPAKSPSFWIKDTEIDSTWGKVGPFWFIQHNRSISHIRMGGMATLTIDYSDYQVTGVDRRVAQGQGQTPVLPDPSSVTPQR